MMMLHIKKLLSILIVMVLNCISVQASRLFNEAHYQNEWCNKWNGQTEVILNDNTRIDCETKNYVAEFDFAKKWAEAIGQSLHYGRMTGKKPAIILIIEKPSDFKYFNRIKPLCKEHGITLWYMKGVFYNSKGKPLILKDIKKYFI